MSIIYDALKRIEQKTKGAQENLGTPKRKAPKSRRIVYVLFALIILCLLTLFVDRPSTEKSFIDRSLIGKQPSSLKTSLIPPVPKKKVPAKVIPLSAPEKESSAVKKLPPLYLTGIFFSDGEYLALINDQMVKAGDSVEGIQIEEIDSTGADIKFEGSSFRLNYP